MKNAPVIVLCAGGHSKVLVNALLAMRAELIGLVDEDPQKHGASLLGVSVIGGHDLVLTHDPGSVWLVNGLGSVDSLRRRRLLFERYKTRGYRFLSVVHPAATVAREVDLGEGAQVMAGAVIQPGTVIGQDTIVNTRTSIDHDCWIGAHCHIAPGAVLSGTVRVGGEVHVGTGAVLINNITVGDRALIAAGTIVIRDVPEEARIAGSPGRAMRAK